MTVNIFRRGYAVEHLEGYDALNMYYICNAHTRHEYLGMTWPIGGTRPVVFKTRDAAESFLHDFCGDLAAHHGTVVPVWEKKTGPADHYPFPRSVYLVKKTGVRGPKGQISNILFMDDKKKLIPARPLDPGAGPMAHEKNERGVLSVPMKSSTVQQTLVKVIPAGASQAEGMKFQDIRKGDTFFTDGEPHIAACDAHRSGDASYDGYLVYDKEDESYFPEDVDYITK